MRKERKCDICNVSSVEKGVFNYKKYGMCLCNKHYGQMVRHGKIVDPTARTIKDKNEIVTCEDHAELIIRNKVNKVVATVLIDLEDVDRVATKKWNVVPDTRHTYIYCKTPCHTKLHRFVMNYYGNKEIDHINHNTLDNRKSNLRIVTRSENASNTTKTCIHNRGNVWFYDIVRFGKRYTKSGFKSYEEAENALRKCKSEVASRVNELLDEFNRKKKNYPGVYLHHGKYQAVYYAKGIKHCIGSFNSAEEASAARERYIQEHK